MEFEEMKVIWDSQDKQPLYAVDQSALKRTVMRKGRGIARRIAAFETTTIVVFVAMAGFLALDSALSGTDPHQYFVAPVWLAAAAYVVWQRVRRKQLELRFDETLDGMLGKAIAQIDYHVSRARSLVWWYMIPLLVTAGVDLAFDADGRPWVWIVGIVLLIPVTRWASEWEVQKCDLPKKRDLESLREKLTEPIEQS